MSLQYRIQQIIGQLIHDNKRQLLTVTLATLALPVCAADVGGLNYQCSGGGWRRAKL